MILIKFMFSDIHFQLPLHCTEASGKFGLKSPLCNLFINLMYFLNELGTLVWATDWADLADMVDMVDLEDMDLADMDLEDMAEDMAEDWVIRVSVTASKLQIANIIYYIESKINVLCCCASAGTVESYSL